MTGNETLQLTGTKAERDKVAESIALIRRAERLALSFDPENGYWLAFSGGKDSQVVYHLAKMAGVRFRAVMTPTTVDPPNVLRFVRRYYPDVEIIRPKVSIFEMAKRKHILPTMARRWCCSEFKEIFGGARSLLWG